MSGFFFSTVNQDDLQSGDILIKIDNQVWGQGIHFGPVVDSSGFRFDVRHYDTLTLSVTAVSKYNANVALHCDVRTATG